MDEAMAMDGATDRVMGGAMDRATDLYTKWFESFYILFDLDLLTDDNPS